MVPKRILLPKIHWEIIFEGIIFFLLASQNPRWLTSQFQSLLKLLLYRKWRNSFSFWANSFLCIVWAKYPVPDYFKCWVHLVPKRILLPKIHWEIIFEGIIFSFLASQNPRWLTSQFQSRVKLLLYRKWKNSFSFWVNSFLYNVRAKFPVHLVSNVQSIWLPRGFFCPTSIGKFFFKVLSFVF